MADFASFWEKKFKMCICQNRKFGWVTPVKQDFLFSRPNGLGRSSHQISYSSGLYMPTYLYSFKVIFGFLAPFGRKQCWGDFVEECLFVNIQ